MPALALLATVATGLRVREQAAGRVFAPWLLGTSGAVLVAPVLGLMLAGPAVVYLSQYDLVVRSEVLPLGVLALTLMQMARQGVERGRVALVAVLWAAAFGLWLAGAWA